MVNFQYTKRKYSRLLQVLWMWEGFRAAFVTALPTGRNALYMLLCDGFVLGWYKRVSLPSSAPLVFVGAKLAYNGDNKHSAATYYTLIAAETLTRCIGFIYC